MPEEEEKQRSPADNAKDFARDQLQNKITDQIGSKLGSGAAGAASSGATGAAGSVGGAAAAGTGAGAAAGSALPGIGTVAGAAAGFIVAKVKKLLLKVVAGLAVGVMGFVVLFVGILFTFMWLIFGGTDTASANPAQGIGLTDTFCGKEFCPDNLESLFERAAQWAKMPAGVLVVVASIEDSVLDLNESQVDAWSLPGAKMEVTENWPTGCPGNPEAASNGEYAQGPMQFIPSTWTGNNYQYGNASVEAGEREGIENYQGEVCNVLDSIFAAAKYLKNLLKDAEGNPVPFDQLVVPWTFEQFEDVLISYGSFSGPHQGGCDGDQQCIQEHHQDMYDLYISIASVSAGPGDQACFVFDDSWTAEDQAIELEAIQILTKSGLYVQLLCQGEFQVTLSRVIPGWCQPYSCRDGTTLHLNASQNQSPPARLFTLTHEATHFLIALNLGLYNTWTDSGIMEKEGIIHTYLQVRPIDCSPLTDECYNEGLSEAAAWYVANSSGVNTSMNLSTSYPETYQWVKQNFFGGYEYTE